MTSVYKGENNYCIFKNGLVKCALCDFIYMFPPYDLTAHLNFQSRRFRTFKLAIIRINIEYMQTKKTKKTSQRNIFRNGENQRLNAGFVNGNIPWSLQINT